MPFESKESIRRVHSVVDQISASVSLRESQSANLNLENNSLILLKWMQKPSSKSLNPLGVDSMDYIWIGKLGFETLSGSGLG